MEYIRKSRPSKQDSGVGVDLYYSSTSSVFYDGPSLQAKLNFQQKLDTFYDRATAVSKNAFGPKSRFVGVLQPTLDEIHYVIGERDRFNPCSHWKNDVVSYPYSEIKNANNSSGTYYESLFRRTAALSPKSIVPIDVHYTKDIIGARSRAYLTMLPRFEGEMSLINFLIELKDVKELLNMGLKALRELRRLRHRFGIANLKKGFDPTLSVANVGLAYNFGVVPLLADLSTIISQINLRIQQLQDDFIKDGETENTRHYSEVLFEDMNGTYGSNNNRTMFNGLRKASIFAATLKYTYKYKRQSNFRAGNQFWGMNLTPEALWNALPFSFLLDYFVKIGDAIRYNTRDPNLTLETHDYCDSLKSVYTSGLHIKKGEFRSVLAINLQPTTIGIVSGYDSSIYNRWRSSPQKLGFYKPKKAKSLTYAKKFNLLALVRCAFS